MIKRSFAIGFLGWLGGRGFFFPGLAVVALASSGLAQAASPASPALASPLAGVPPVGAGSNRLERLEWFRDLGFGLFIHWSVDSQIGTVISHSMVGASEDYVKRFLNEGYMI